MKAVPALSILVAAAIACHAVPARAADTVIMFPIRDAYGLANIDQYLDKSVAFYFGTTPHPVIAQSFGSFSANHRANSFGRSEQHACSRAFLNAMLALQERAKTTGGNAVVRIVSYFRKVEVSNNTAFECHEGTLMAGVTLKGDVVRLASR